MELKRKKIMLIALTLSLEIEAHCTLDKYLPKDAEI